MAQGGPQPSLDIGLGDERGDLGAGALSGGNAGLAVDGIQPMWEGDSLPAEGDAPLRQSATDRAGRYYGASRSTSDLATSDLVAAADGTHSQRGAPRVQPSRLAVFGQRPADDRKLVFAPYLEAGQVGLVPLSSASPSSTYSSLAAGMDAVVNGHNHQGVVSLRYDRRLGRGAGSNTGSLTGVAHLSSALIPDTLRLDYGAYAGRSHMDTNGADAGRQSQSYSFYAGPTLTTHAGPVAVTGHYHFGHTLAGGGAAGTGTTGTATAQPGVDVFDHSSVHQAKLSAGLRPGEVLPVGVSLEAGAYREDIANLAQRAEDAHLRGEIMVPVAQGLALVAGLGREKVRVSSHDAVRIAGVAQTDGAGHLVTDFTSPRSIAYDSAGLIWDAGVIWRPSRRTNMEIHAGRRYGAFGGFGIFTYQPDNRTSLSLVAYDNLTGFGGGLTNALFNLPTQFWAVRDAITGNLNACLGSRQSGGCLETALGSANSAVHRSHGWAASYGLDLGSIRAGIGLGYDHRRYITASQTVLAGINGLVDQDYWLAAYLDGRLSENATFQAALNVYRFQSGVSSTGDETAIRAVGTYQYMVSRHLTANASLAIDGILRRQPDEVWTASGAVGMRYAF